MRAIWDILVANPFLFILIIGALSGLFRRKAPDAEEQRKRQQQQRQKQTQQTQQTTTQSSYPNRVGDREERPKHAEQKPQFDWDMDIFGETRDELEKKVRDTLSPYMEKKKEQASTIQERMKDEVKELSIKGQEISKDSPILKQELQISEGKVVKSNHRIKPKRVVEGIMWAEILGQPRSRNPHRPVYSQHFSGGNRKK